MPIIKSAIKRLRKDKKRTAFNKTRKERLRKLIKEAIKSKTASKILAAVSFVDKMKKVHLIHPNKASRLKSKLSKLIPQKGRTSPRKARKKAS